MIRCHDISNVHLLLALQGWVRPKPTSGLWCSRLQKSVWSKVRWIFLCVSSYKHNPRMARWQDLPDEYEWDLEHHQTIRLIRWQTYSPADWYTALRRKNSQSDWAGNSVSGRQDRFLEAPMCADISWTIPLGVVEDYLNVQPVHAVSDLSARNLKTQTFKYCTSGRFILGSIS